eukprot:TRINITY_DN20092_c0_g1_i1.p1 TRINITY_DN20092_c0_g1~~TRINITY_DN20092_c0_g1_i1.p1  ORF type:complete len:265 (+),score=43.43 TRINITY_DN20092_c0_g1_i1:99-797(+)
MAAPFLTASRGREPRKASRPPLKSMQKAMRPATAKTKFMEEETQRSLQIRNDDRYEQMQYYTEHGGTAAETGHFARVCRTNRRMHGKDELKKNIHADASLKDIAEMEIQEPVNEWEQRQKPSNSVTERVEWNETFDRAVKRLFVDFDLTDVPSSRLAHLERMHTWFEEHGAKQTRKSQQGPSYITAERSGKMPAGSTRNIAAKPSDAALVMVGSYVTGNRSARPGFSGVVPS